MAKSDKPNILFIMSDDIGWFNVSCYNHGIMGYRTPNIDRIAAEGAMFTDSTASRVVLPAERRSSPGSNLSGQV
jgi:arylsulfatase A-like enzyme